MSCLLVQLVSSIELHTNVLVKIYERVIVWLLYTNKGLYNSSKTTYVLFISREINTAVIYQMVSVSLFINH